MTFFCLTMSPAIDATVSLPCKPQGVGETIKNVRETTCVGGKGVNVARWLSLRGADVICGGLLGEDDAAPFVRECVRYGIREAFVRVPGPTRRNEMVVWPDGSVKLNRSAFPDVPADFFVPERFLQAAQGCAVAILSGSLPVHCPPTFYADCIAMLKRAGVKVVLDTSGAALREGIAAGPHLIKPNAEECGELLGLTLASPNDFKHATNVLREKAASVIVSDGAAGAWFDGVFVPAPTVDVLDTTAAGDTLLAEYCWRYFVQNDPESPRWAVRAGSAACTMPGGTPVRPTH